jgi:hypothetical protein
MTNGEKGEAHQSTLQGQTRTSKMTAEGLAWCSDVKRHCNCPIWLLLSFFQMNGEDKILAWWSDQALKTIGNGNRFILNIKQSHFVKDLYCIVACSSLNEEGQYNSSCDL